MAISRYNFSNKIRNGKYYGSSKVNSRINQAIRARSISFSTSILATGQRLDHLAHIAYGNANLWWVIAAASGIGWGLQVPAGTLIVTPDDINEVYNLL